MPRTAATVVRRAVESCVGKLLDAQPLLAADRPLPDGDTPVHAARVACRRLRSDLRTFQRLLDQAWTKRLRAELKWLADLLGAARDAEVLRDRLRQTAAGDLDPAEVAALDAVLADRAASARRRLIRALNAERHRRLMAALTVAGRDLPLRRRAARPAREVLPDLVRRPWRKLATAADALSPDATDEQWHTVRILAKRARYAADAAAGTVPGARGKARRLAVVQEVLGEHQDAVLAGRTWREMAGTAPFTAGRLVEREAAAARKARAAFPAAWRKAALG